MGDCHLFLSAGSVHYRGYLSEISKTNVSQRTLDGKRGDYDKVTTLNLNNVQTDNSKPVRKAATQSHGSTVKGTETTTARLPKLNPQYRCILRAWSNLRPGTFCFSEAVSIHENGECPKEWQNRIIELLQKFSVCSVALWRGPKNAIPYMGVVFRNGSKTKQERRKNGGRTKEDFSWNHSIVPPATPRYGGTL